MDDDYVKCLGFQCGLKKFCLRYREKEDKAITNCDEVDRDGFISKGF